MELEVKYYDLPDLEAVKDPSDSGSIFLWQPDRNYIVLGRASNADTSLIKERVTYDGVDVLKRPSGGETVLLTPRMAVFAASMKFAPGMNTRKVFSEINKKLIIRLSGLGIKNLHSRGISDLSIGVKKIAGSSMYLNRGVLFYHAVLNISEEVSMISRYIKHPQREPDYRQGRSHEDFVTSLAKEGYKFDYSDIKKVVSEALAEAVKQKGCPD
ncbi:MAG: hypothetical protein PHP30_00270 [Bacteroidales bacterium]|nr:hypothetical protein [Bacteroidales bacterium]